VGGAVLILKSTRHYGIMNRYTTIRRSELKGCATSLASLTAQLVCGTLLPLDLLRNKQESDAFHMALITRRA
jgi:hypothetical protein